MAPGQPVGNRIAICTSALRPIAATKVSVDQHAMYAAMMDQR
jgi:hypothetical protein